MDNVEIIRSFMQAWSRLDVDELLTYFAEDGVYHNMPSGPIAGQENLKPFIGGFIANWRSTNWEVLTLIGEGDRVVAERVDRTVVGDVNIDLPCCGVFEMENGKIKVWRDYFDLATFMKPLQAG